MILILLHYNSSETYKKNYKVYSRNGIEINDEGMECITHSLFDDQSLSLTYVNSYIIDVIFTQIYPIYCKKYDILNKFSPHSIFDMKIQKTIPGQGYHIWHTESMDKKSSNRICVFSLYLNDVLEGGETEFLYQKLRISPKKNKFVIWPSGYTHVHRGNQPLSGEKYIITGWIEYGS